MSFTAGSTGGKYNHSISLEELPQHEHPIKTAGANKWIGSWKSNTSSGELWDVFSPTNDDQYVDYAIATKDERSKASKFNLINPYITVYIWKRTQ